MTETAGGSEKWLLGGATPGAPARILRAGSVQALFEPRSGFLRFVRCGERELLRGVYAAVRNRNWETVVPRISDVVVEEARDSFRVTFVALCRGHGIDFQWRGELVGEASGRISYSFRGEAREGLEANRIGFCVLHPAGILAGRPCTVEKVDGTTEEGRFPDLIQPHQPFFDIRAIRHEVEPGLSVEVRMTGETFEMEDQRNWTDASYKTYSRPLQKGFPFPVAAGETVEQAVEITLIGSAPIPPARSDESMVTIEWNETPGPLPALGLGMASHGEALSERERQLLRTLGPAHLRVDLHLLVSDWLECLEQAAGEADALEAGLELVLHLGGEDDEVESSLRALAGRLASLSARVHRVLVLRSGETSTSTRWGALARRTLKPVLPGVPLGVGTDAFFAELNRARPSPEATDLVCFSVNPQVHAFDETSMVETLEAQPMAVASARAFSGGRPVTVSPVTLRMRFNPNATGPEPSPAPGELPAAVDPRQMSLFAAAWTLGSVRALAEGEAASATFYETTGWRGVMEREAGSRLPERFPSEPGGVFPVYHVLADLCRDPGADALLLRSSSPLVVQALALRSEERYRVLVANLEPREHRVRLALPRLAFRGRVLDLESVFTAVASPDEFRASAPLRVDASPNGEVELKLGAYGVVALEG